MEMTNIQELEHFRLEIVYMCGILLEFLRGWKEPYRSDWTCIIWDSTGRCMAAFINVMWTIWEFDTQRKLLCQLNLLWVRSVPSSNGSMQQSGEIVSGNDLSPQRHVSLLPPCWNRPGRIWRGLLIDYVENLKGGKMYIAMYVCNCILVVVLFVLCISVLFRIFLYMYCGYYKKS